jgi:uncharacterized protein
MTAADTMALLDWKRRVFGLYESVRAMEPEEGWTLWRETRDDLFRSHPQSPLPPEKRDGFEGLEYWPYDPEARVLAELEDVEAPEQPIETSGVEPMLFQPFARAWFELGGERLSLDVHWLTGYGGGVFLPVRDATGGQGSYGGGRYVLDTVKGSDLGERDGRLVLDFNFAYNPSCAYDPSWVCPLAPPANRISVAVEAGERYAS